MANTEKNTPAVDETTVVDETPAVDEAELEAAREEARRNAVKFFEIEFKKPIKYNNKEYAKLSFDFDKLTGLDGLAIEEELQMMNKAVIVPALSGEYLIRMAARACTERIGADIFNVMPLRDFNRIRSAARSFLILSE